MLRIGISNNAFHIPSMTLQSSKEKQTWTLITAQKGWLVPKYSVHMNIMRTNGNLVYSVENEEMREYTKDVLSKKASQFSLVLKNKGFFRPRG